MDLTLVVFLCVYGVMISGRAPGLRLDRTGTALLGGIALVAGGTITSAQAWQSIDVGTMGLLLGLMVVSAQFRLSGFYAALTRWLARRPTSPERMLGELVLATGTLSALLTNDVVCIAIAPVLVDVCVRRQLDPVPFLLALAGAANVGSAATLIGNPQNMLIGQSLNVPFGGYLLDGCVPAVVGMLVVWWIIGRSYRNRFTRTLALTALDEQPLDRWQTSKGFVVLGVLVLGLLLCPLPREIQALSAAGVLLVSRQLPTRRLLGEIDWQLLLLFVGLFVCNHGFQHAGHAAAAFGWLRDQGLDLAHPGALFVTSVVGSNLVSNVPVTMLLLPTADHPQAAPILCLATTLAGNLLLVGSIANLIVVEQAQRLGVSPFGRSWLVEHLRSGVPITLLTLGMAAVWLWIRS